MNTQNSAYYFFIGWFVILLLFWGGTQFEGTRTLIYYVLWLNIALTLVTHSSELRLLLQGAVPNPISETGTGNISSTPSSTPEIPQSTVITHTTPYVQFSALG